MKPRFRTLGCLVLAVLALLAAFSWQTLMHNDAMFAADQRPALLDDANWETPESAVAFGKRFAPGVPEAELLSWLRSENFLIHARQRQASRHVRATICPESILVRWSVDAAGRLTWAQARFFGGVCY